MGDGEPSPRKRRPGAGSRAFMLALFGLLAASAPGLADLRPPARARGQPPMRFVRVVDADPACAPNCPEWLSAEGRIAPGTAAALAQAVESLGGRRLPILIHSPGGSVADAIRMGELIRAKGLAVAVARTLITNCPERLEVPERTGQSDDRRRDVRLGLRARSRRRRRASRSARRSGSAFIRPPRC